jgi:galactose mutarotase-like enzyme
MSLGNQVNDLSIRKPIYEGITDQVIELQASLGNHPYFVGEDFRRIYGVLPLYKQHNVSPTSAYAGLKKIRPVLGDDESSSERG